MKIYGNQLNILLDFLRSIGSILSISSLILMQFTQSKATLKKKSYIKFSVFTTFVNYTPFRSLASPKLLLLNYLDEVMLKFLLGTFWSYDTNVHSGSYHHLSGFFLRICSSKYTHTHTHKVPQVLQYFTQRSLEGKNSCC